MTRRRMVVVQAVCVLAAGAIAAARVEQGAVRITKDPQGYWFTEGDTKVLFYQAERKALPDGQAARSNYFHPLYDLDGNVLTEDFPKDHIHHRGIFWAWHQVRIDGKTVQDQWVNRDSFWNVQDARIDVRCPLRLARASRGLGIAAVHGCPGAAPAVRRGAERHPRSPGRGRDSQDRLPPAADGARRRRRDRRFRRCQGLRRLLVPGRDAARHPLHGRAGRRDADRECGRVRARGWTCRGAMGRRGRAA